jgi:hypothetical protein
MLQGIEDGEERRLRPKLRIIEQRPLRHVPSGRAYSCHQVLLYQLYGSQMPHVTSAQTAGSSSATARKRA